MKEERAVEYKLGDQVRWLDEERMKGHFPLVHVVFTIVGIVSTEGMVKLRGKFIDERELTLKDWVPFDEIVPVDSVQLTNEEIEMSKARMQRVKA